MLKKVSVLILFLFLIHGKLGLSADRSADRIPVIGSPRNASYPESLAASEIRRYLYLRTGKAVEIRNAEDVFDGKAPLILVSSKEKLPPQAKRRLGKKLDALGAGEFLLKTEKSSDRKILYVAGGDAVGTLYGAYRVAEKLGVRFFLHGDTIPDGRIPLSLPDLDEYGKPLFALRGIQPFHDFPEGPDWWNLDDYKAILSQLPKLRMNFFGLHTYPEKRPDAEPTVWIGLPSDVGKSGEVSFAYQTSYHNTLRGNWGYTAKKSGDFVCGASLLFECDAYGSEVMLGYCPRPEGQKAYREVFRRTGRLFRQAFRHARRLGIKICVGTETPLLLPRLVRERIKASGRDPSDPKVIQEVYEGIFLRIMRTHPLDYYWFWTPEGWTWSGVKREKVEETIRDIKLAVRAAAAVRAPFKLGTCGWVLGPQYDRSLFDKVLPPELFLSCINRQVGKSPVDPGFSHCRRKDKWAIQWLEDDPGLTSPQLWVGRMREDARDAHRYGCNGLMGIHWRTRILAPNVLALAWAAWDQSGWTGRRASVASLPTEGPVGGAHARFPRNPIADTEDDPLYQSVRYNVDSYVFKVPNGLYKVTLKFSEPHYRSEGKRVFGVKIQGKSVIDKLDIFKRVGANRALDFSFEGVRVTEGRLDIEFVKIVEYPSVAAIAVEGPVTRKVNCGGGKYRDWAADWPQSAPRPRGLPCGGFYRDWAQHEFGPEIGGKAAGIFERVDGHLPCPSQWVHGPGGIRPDARPWKQVRKEYEFVDELARLRPLVKGKGNLSRFDYWLNSFRYMRALAEVRCIWARYEKALKKVEALKDQTRRREEARKSLLPVRVELVRKTEEVHLYLLSTVSTTGGMGTVMNLEEHILPDLIEKPGRRLSELLGAPLPAEADLRSGYSGPSRIIVPTLRSSIGKGERLKLKVIILDSGKPRTARLLWRGRFGRGPFQAVPLKHVARGVYTATFPEAATRSPELEYYIEVEDSKGTILRFPAASPELNQTVVVLPEE